MKITTEIDDKFLRNEAAIWQALDAIDTLYLARKVSAMLNYSVQDVVKYSILHEFLLIYREDGSSIAEIANHIGPLEDDVPGFTPEQNRKLKEYIQELKEFLDVLLTTSAKDKHPTVTKMKLE